MVKKAAASPERSTVPPKTNPSHAPAGAPRSAPPSTTATNTKDTEKVPKRMNETRSCKIITKAVRIPSSTSFLVEILFLDILLSMIFILPQKTGCFYAFLFLNVYRMNALAGRQSLVQPVNFFLDQGNPSGGVRIFKVLFL